MEIPFVMLLNEETDEEGRNLAWLRGWQPGDRMVLGWIGHVQVARKITLLEKVAQRNVCETVFGDFNADDRPNGRMNRSMCKGDVVMLLIDGDWVAWVAETVGFARVDEVRSVVTDRSKEFRRPKTGSAIPGMTMGDVLKSKSKSEAVFNAAKRRKE